MAKDAIFTVKEAGKPLRLVQAKNIGAVQSHLLSSVTIEKVKDAMTAVSLSAEVGGKIEIAGEAAALAPTPLETAITGTHATEAKLETEANTAAKK